MQYYKGVRNMKDRIRQYIIENHYPFTMAEFLGDWEGYEVYEPIMETEEYMDVGLPVFVLVKGEDISTSTRENAFDILDHFYPDESE